MRRTRMRIAAGVGACRLALGVAGVALVVAAARADDAARFDATEAMRAGLRELGVRAREHERDRDDYGAGCRGGTAVTTERGVAGWIANAETPECRILANRWLADDEALRNELAAEREAARRAGVQPGAVRDAIKRNGLDDYTSPRPEPAFRGGAMPRD